MRKKRRIPRLKDHAKARERGLARRLDRLRFRGHEGGFIARHRALLHSPCDPRKILSAVLLGAAFLVLWYLALDHVVRFWAGVMSFASVFLGVNAECTVQCYTFGDSLQITVPFLHQHGRLPGPVAWWIGLILTLVVVIATFLTPRRYMPAVYFLRIVAFFQGCAQIFFAFWPRHFPYDAGGYLLTMLVAGIMIVTLVPIVLAFTYYLFDFRLVQKIGLTLIVTAYLCVMIPFQYSMHACVIHYGSLLALPFMFFVLGIPLNVMVFIALYAWGFSWKNKLKEESVQWRAPDCLS
jgi:hypothetical protein